MPAYFSGDLSRKWFKKGVYKARIKRKALLNRNYYVRRGYILADNRIIKLNRGHYATYVKRLCNRRIRHKEDVGNYSNYRRVCEYQYEID